MGSIGKTISTKISDFIIHTIELRLGYKIEAPLYSPAGIDAPGLPDDKAFVVQKDGSGKFVALGTLNVSRGAKAGELVLYSRDSGGAVKAKIHLLANGSIEIDAPADLSLSGNLNVGGNVAVTGGDVTADGISLKTHLHLGNLGYNTGPPLPSGGGVSPPANTPSSDASGQLILKDGTVLDVHIHAPGTYTNSGGPVTGVSGGPQ